MMQSPRAVHKKETVVSRCELYINAEISAKLQVVQPWTTPAWYVSTLEGSPDPKI
jgi:hypothetical protein